MDFYVVGQNEIGIQQGGILIFVLIR